MCCVAETACVGAEVGAGFEESFSFQDKCITLSFPKKEGTFWCKGCEKQILHQHHDTTTRVGSHINQNRIVINQNRIVVNQNLQQEAVRQDEEHDPEEDMIMGVKIRLTEHQL